jgi:SNF2 family DNA or RNA helicase
LLKDIFDRIAPYIHRLDSSVLQQDLPPIQQAVIHVRQSTAQMKLYRAFKKFQTTSDSNNFLDQYSKLFTVNNHPGALLFRRKGAMIRIAERSKISSTLDDKLASQDDHGKLKGIKEEEPSMEPQAIMDDKRERPFPKSGVEIITIDDSDDDLEAEERFQENENFTILPRQMQTSCRNSDQEEWWEKASESIPNLTDVENGGKMILLLQILAHSEMLGKLKRNRYLM